MVNRSKDNVMKNELREGAVSDEELEKEINEIENELNEKNAEVSEIIVKSSKSIGKIKKGDKIKIDGKEYEVDAHYVMIDHGNTKEMAIEMFDESDKDYQLRYFSDQVEKSLEFYELEEIIYNKKIIKKIEW